MNPIRVVVMVLSFTALLHPPGVAAQGNSEGKGNSGKGSRGDEINDLDLIAAGISVLQARQLVQQHDAVGGKPLPPGIRKNLARGKPLPPGVAHSRNLSQPLIRDLPHYQGYEWRQVGLDLVLVAVATELVADVLVGVFE